MLFLQILGGIALAVLVLIVVAVFWARHKLREIISGVSRLGSYSVPVEGRIRLAACGDDAEEGFDEGQLKAYQGWRRELAAAGFAPLAEFEDEAGEGLRWVAHRESGQFAVLSQLGERFIVEYCGLAGDGRACLATPNPVFPGVDGKSLSVRPKRQLTPAEGAAWLDEQGVSRTLSTRQFVLFFEQLHAACMDIRLADPGCRRLVGEWIAFAGLDPLESEDLEEAIELCRLNCEGAAMQAIRDHARVAVNLDDDAWSRIEDELLIISRYTGFEDLADFFEDALAEEFLEQLEGLEMSVSQAFTTLNRRLGAKAQYVHLATVSKPTPSQVYVPRVQLESVDLPTGDLKPGQGLRRFLYQAKDGEDEPVSSSVIAANVSDARALLQRSGCSDIKILSSNQDPARPEAIDMELMAANLIEAQSDSMARALFKIILGNGMLWMPFAFWAGWAVFDGAPFGTSDYIAFVLAFLSFGWALYRALPALLYNASQEALSWGQADRARRYFQWVRKLGAPGIQKTVLGGEEAKMLAYAGEKERALERLEAHRDLMERGEYLAFLAQVYDAARDYRKMIETHARLLEEAPDNQEHRVELALSLLRHDNRVEKAAELLAEVHPSDCSELYAHGLFYAQGLLAGRRGDHHLAVKKLQQAFHGFSAYHNPLVNAVQVEIGGYMAAYLHHSGDHRQAAKIWEQARPRLEAVKAEHVLRVYRAAAEGG